MPYFRNMRNACVTQSDPRRESLQKEKTQPSCLSTHTSVPAMIIQEWSLQQESGAQELILSLLPSPTFCLWAGPVGTWLLPLVFTGGRWPGPGFSLMWFLPEGTPRWGWLCLSLCLHLPASESTPRPVWLRLWMESKHLSTDPHVCRLESV